MGLTLFISLLWYFEFNCKNCIKIYFEDKKKTLFFLLPLSPEKNDQNIFANL